MTPLQGEQEGGGQHMEMCKGTGSSGAKGRLGVKHSCGFLCEWR